MSDSNFEFNYNEETDTLVVKDTDKTEIFKIGKNKYGKLFRYMIKSIDEISNEPTPDPYTFRTTGTVAQFNSHYDPEKTSYVEYISDLHDYFKNNSYYYLNITFDGVEYQNIPSYYMASDRQYTLLIGNPDLFWWELPSDIKVEDISKQCPFLIVACNYELSMYYWVLTRTAGEHELTLVNTGVPSLDFATNNESSSPTFQGDLPEKGSSCQVIFNGVTYTSTVYDVSVSGAGMVIPMLGSYKLAGKITKLLPVQITIDPEPSDEDNNLPFGLLIMPGAAVILFTYEPGDYTVVLNGTDLGTITTVYSTSGEPTFDPVSITVTTGGEKPVIRGSSVTEVVLFMKGISMINYTGEYEFLPDNFILEDREVSSVILSSLNNVNYETAVLDTDMISYHKFKYSGNLSLVEQFYAKQENSGSWRNWIDLSGCDNPDSEVPFLILEDTKYQSGLEPTLDSKTTYVVFDDSITDFDFKVLN